MFFHLVLISVLSSALAEQLLTLQGQGLSREIPACRESNILSCEKVLVHHDVLLTASHLELPMGPRLTVTKAMESEDLSSMAFTLDNESEGAQGVFVYNEKDGNKYIFGTLNWAKKGRHFKLEMCSHSEDCYTWSEINPKFWVDGNGPIHVQEDIETTEEFDKLLDLGRQDTTTPVTVTVTVYTTEKFRASFATPAAMRTFIDLAVAESNQGYANSKVPIIMKLHCILDSTFPDSENGAQLLKNMLNAAGDIDDYPIFRKSADMAVVLATFKDLCGIAYTNVARSGRTLGVVQKGCATGYYTFGHEIGHMYGCMHNKENATRSYVENGYGFWMRPPVDSGYRTILAYAAEGYDTKVNHYSHPTIKFQDIPTGTPTENNANVLTINRFAMAAVGDESETCNL